MQPLPLAEPPGNQGSGRLYRKVALITGGDSGIGRAVAFAFAAEGACLALAFLDEKRDALETREILKEEYNCEALLLAGDLRDDKLCRAHVRKTLKHFGRLDILVNNAAEQHEQNNFLKITKKQLDDTFRTNIFSYFYMVQAALPHLKRGGVIINTSSVTAYRGSDHLVDYSATKGAIVSFTRSLALNLASKGVRVNGVAPGPIWTPLIPASFDKQHVQKFGKKTPMKRAGQPAEVAPCYVFLASEDSSYMTGQVLHPNGGEIVNA